MILIIFLIFHACLFTCPLNVNARKINPRENLDDYNVYMNVTTVYNSKIRPNTTVLITMSMSLKQIVSIDEKNQIMTSNSLLSLQWTDTRLSWDPKNYNNASEILIPVNKLWTPDLFVINTADSNGYIQVSSQSLALVDFTGYIFVVFSLTNLKTRCDIDIRTYPSDTQKCQVNSFIFYNLNFTLRISTRWSC